MAKRRGLKEGPEHDDSQSPELTPPYEVGYCRPPLSGRFKRGHSGNPEGRPKRRPTVRTVVEEALQQTIRVRLGSGTRSLTKGEAMMLTLVNKALQGDPRASATLLNWVRAAGVAAEPAEPVPTGPVTDRDAQIIADFLRRNHDSRDTADESDT